MRQRPTSSTGSAGYASSTSPAAFVYVFNFAARIYWGFVGNKYAQWNAFFPLKKSQRQEIVDVIKADVLQTKLHGAHLHRAQRAGRLHLLLHFPGLLPSRPSPASRSTPA